MMVLAVLGSTQYGCAKRKDAAVPGVPTQAVSANIVRASEVVWQEGSLEIRAARATWSEETGDATFEQVAVRFGDQDLDLRTTTARLDPSQRLLKCAGISMKRWGTQLNARRGVLHLDSYDLEAEEVTLVLDPGDIGGSAPLGTGGGGVGPARRGITHPDGDPRR